MRLSLIVFGQVQPGLFFGARRAFPGWSQTFFGIGPIVGSFGPGLHDAPHSK
jgi:hypothetical protein